MLCLVHDFHEARTGDFNYVNRIYNTSNGKLAMQHATGGTGLEDLLLPLWEEQEDGETQEALLAKDADQLDLIANLVEENALGNKYAAKWLEAATQRLVDYVLSVAGGEPVAHERKRMGEIAIFKDGVTL